MVYAGIGSRRTPPDIQIAMAKIAKQMALSGHILRSGGAAGADHAFEIGCNRGSGLKEIYLPWKNFNGNDSKFHFDREPMSDKQDAAYALASLHHPAWDKLSFPVKKLMARNGFQILGVDLKTPVDFVLCWTSKKWVPGINAGGTSQALRIAYSCNIPIINFVCDNVVIDSFVERVGSITKGL